MSDHSHIDDRIIDYVYGEMGSRDANDVERHIAGCARCADEVHKIQGLRRAALTLPKLMPAPHVTETILRRARELAPKTQQRGWLASFLLRPAFGGAFLFAIALGVGLYIVRSDDRRALQEPVGVGVALGRDPPVASRAAAPAAGPSIAKADAERAAPGSNRQTAPGATTLEKTTLATSTPTTPPSTAREGAVDPAPSALQPPPPPKARALAEPRIIARVARPAPESLFPGAAGAAVPAKAPAEPKAKTELDRVARADVAAVPGRADENRDALSLGFSGVAKKAPARAEPSIATGAKASPASQEEMPLPSSPKDVKVIARVSRDAPQDALDDSRSNAQDRGAIRSALPPGTLQQLAQNAPAPAAARPPLDAPSQAQPAPAAPPPPAHEDAAKEQAIAQAVVPQAAAEREEHAGGDREYARQAKRASTTATRAQEPSPGRAMAEALLAKAEAEHARGDLRAAVATLNQLLRSNPGYATPRAYELLAASHERLGEHERASAVRAQARRELRRALPAAKAR